MALFHWQQKELPTYVTVQFLTYYLHMPVAPTSNYRDSPGTVAKRLPVVVRT